MMASAYFCRAKYTLPASRAARFSFSTSVPQAASRPTHDSSRKMARQVFIPYLFRLRSPQRRRARGGIHKAVHDAFDPGLEDVHVEVDQQTNGPTPKFQIRQQLGSVNRLKP